MLRGLKAEGEQYEQRKRRRLLEKGVKKRAIIPAFVSAFLEEFFFVVLAFFLPHSCAM